MARLFCGRGMAVPGGARCEQRAAHAALASPHSRIPAALLPTAPQVRTALTLARRVPESCSVARLTSWPSVPQMKKSDAYRRYMMVLPLNSKNEHCARGAPPRAALRRVTRAVRIARGALQRAGLAAKGAAAWPAGAR